MSERSPVNALQATGDGQDLISVAEAVKGGKNIAEIIRNISTTNTPIEPTLLSSPSKALYAESGIGINEALESYAVDMRRLEVEKQLTDIMVTQDSLGKKYIMNNQVYRNVSYVINDKVLTLKIGGNPVLGDWNVYLAGIHLDTITLFEGEFEYDIDISEDVGLPMNESYPIALIKT